MRTRALLIELVRGEWNSETHERLRNHAEELLRHFPEPIEIAVVGKKVPDYFAVPGSPKPEAS